MNFLHKIWLWVVYSSANADKISLSIKGAGGVIVTVAFLLIGVFHFNVSQVQVTDLFDAAMLAVSATLTALSYASAAVSAWAVVWGLCRKIVTTMAGENEVVASFGARY